jgi:hypothetical protein
MRAGKVMLIALVLILALPFAASASDDPNERKEKIKGNGIIITVRFFVGTVGMGMVQCGTCHTAGGCKSLWCDINKPVTCRAKPRKGWKFSHWTTDDKKSGDKPHHRICRKGVTLKAHFVKVQ